MITTKLDPIEVLSDARLAICSGVICEQDPIRKMGLRASWKILYNAELYLTTGEIVCTRLSSQITH